MKNTVMQADLMLHSVKNEIKESATSDPLLKIL